MWSAIHCLLEIHISSFAECVFKEFFFPILKYRLCFDLFLLLLVGWLVGRVFYLHCFVVLGLNPEPHVGQRSILPLTYTLAWGVGAFQKEQR